MDLLGIHKRLGMMPKSHILFGIAALNKNLSTRCNNVTESNRSRFIIRKNTEMAVWLMSVSPASRGLKETMASHVLSPKTLP